MKKCKTSRRNLDPEKVVYKYYDLSLARLRNTFSHRDSAAGSFLSIQKTLFLIIIQDKFRDLGTDPIAGCGFRHSESPKYGQEMKKYKW